MHMKQPDHTRTKQILHSLDELKQADAPAFLATRLRARLHEQATPSVSIWDRAGNWLARPGVFATVLVLILAVNAGFLWKELPTEPSATNAIPIHADEETDAFAVSDSNSPLLP